MAQFYKVQTLTGLKVVMHIAFSMYKYYLQKSVLVNKH